MGRKSDAIDKIVEQATKHYPKIVKVVSELKPIGKNNITYVSRELGLSRATVRTIVYMLALMGYLKLEGDGNNLFIDVPDKEIRRVITLDHDAAQKLEKVREIIETWLLIPVTPEMAIQFLLYHIENLDKPLALERLMFIHKKMNENQK